MCLCSLPPLDRAAGYRAYHFSLSASTAGCVYLRRLSMHEGRNGGGEGGAPTYSRCACRLQRAHSVLTSQCCVGTRPQSTSVCAPAPQKRGGNQVCLLPACLPCGVLRQEGREGGREGPAVAYCGRKVGMNVSVNATQLKVTCSYKSKANASQCAHLRICSNMRTRARLELAHARTCWGPRSPRWCT